MDTNFDAYDTRAIAISAHSKAEMVMERAAETATLAAVLYRILVEVVHQHPTVLDLVRHQYEAEPAGGFRDTALTIIAAFHTDVHSPGG